jgi:hypothetical protein
MRRRSAIIFPLTLGPFKALIEVAHPPCVEGVTMPSTKGGISLLGLKLELLPLSFQFD